MPTAEELIGYQVARDLVSALRDAAPSREFATLEAACGRMDGLALRERVDLLAGALLADVPGEYGPLAAVVTAARDGARGLDGWMIWPVTVAVARRAVADTGEDTFDDAMTLLASLTPRLSAEFALRLMLRADLHRALRTARAWVTSDDAHVRRLASEGTRPYLPWALRVPGLLAEPGITVPILDALHDDESEYVRRSVANHLNDLSRDAPQAAVEAAARWLRNPAPTTARVVRHGLRTLVKKGDAGALALLGYAAADVVVDGFRVLTPEVAFPGSLRFSATVRNDGAEPARVALDYVVHHQRANGTRTPKTFKLATPTLAPGERFGVDREHEFRPITTRRYYSGTHAVALQVNGQATEPLPFVLTGVVSTKGT
ncbi:DNA alkylation repair protein [Actinacidiphila acididurans]|uniref:DNA alkylation repair protein n=1 Tax=Actinacidiphila acididurans TaxID=2784346 RepID=A0ABS2U3G1_9ACTN|nr:DNA alkylation repair protein [Actinacidiphila acididurans]MBM9510138.1 DNA alkylation repair protein [Actinacidiphila acididurans]